MMDSVDGMAVIGILRGVEPSFFPDLMAASYAGGLRALEVTMNTRGAEDMVADNLAMVPDGTHTQTTTIRNHGKIIRHHIFCAPGVHGNLQGPQSTGIGSCHQIGEK